MKRRHNVLVLEGPDGSGKSTIARLLAERYERRGQRAVVVHMPGATEKGGKIRSIVTEYNDADPYGLMMLFFADFHFSMREIIAPALDEGKMVILDRFFLSTLVYQYYRYPPSARNRRVFSFIRDEWELLRHGFNIRPLHFVLRIPIEELKERIRRRPDVTGFERDIVPVVAGYGELLAESFIGNMVPIRSDVAGDRLSEELADRIWWIAAPEDGTSP